MSSSSCYVDDVHNWDDRKDDLAGALEYAEKAPGRGLGHVEPRCGSGRSARRSADPSSS